MFSKSTLTFGVLYLLLLIWAPHRGVDGQGILRSISEILPSQFQGTFKNLLGGSTSRGRSGGLLDSVGQDKYIYRMTEGLSSGAPRRDKSCLINNQADLNILTPAPVVIRNFLRDECDSAILHYRAQKFGKQCVMFLRSSTNQWINIDIRSTGLDSEKEINTNGFKCGNYEENVVRLWAKRSACLETKLELERRCDACDLKVVAEPAYRTRYEKCMIDMLKPTDGPGQVSEAAKRCKCYVSNEVGFPQTTCRKDVSPLSPWTKQRLGECLSVAFGVGDSCLDKNKQGRKSIINGQQLRDALLKCERETLRYKVDTVDGCVYKKPGYDFVWHGAQSGFVQERLSADIKSQFDLRIRTAPFLTCDKDKNSNSLNALKQMCQKTKDLSVLSGCDSCQLRVLVDAGARERVRTCVVERKLSSPISFAGPAVDICIGQEASKLGVVC